MHDTLITRKPAISELEQIEKKVFFEASIFGYANARS